MPKYVLLTGAKSNVGDHLIVSRAKQLLRKHIPNVKLIEIPRWKPLDQYLNVVNTSQGLILCGGPAYKPDLYPGIYPLTDDLEKIKVPIIPFGLGWHGIPGDEQTVRNYRFSALSIKLLERVHRDNQFTSCRDYLTKRVLERHGFTNVIMTGDPAWYDLQYLEKPFLPPRKIGTIALSTPARKIYYDQCVDLLIQVKSTFPKAKILCTFHHGWKKTKYVSDEFAKEQNLLKERLLDEGCEVVNLASNIQYMEQIYSKVDIHVGYRLHAHLYFLSHRKPSFLLEEDGRGRGASEALGLRGIPAWSRTIFDFLPSNAPAVFRRIENRIIKRLKARKEAAEEIVEMIKNATSSKFAWFRGLHLVFLHYYHEAMVPFLKSVFK